MGWSSSDGYPMPALAQTEPTGRCNFSGSYILDDVRGDVDVVYRDLGYGWFSRMLSSMTAYGCDSTRLVIQQSESALVIDKTTARGETIHTSLSWGTAKQKAEFEFGPSHVVVSWDENVLQLVIRRLCNSVVVTSRYSKTGRILIEEVKSFKGRVATFLWRNCSV